MPSAISAICSASVPELTLTQCVAPQKAASLCFQLGHFRPENILAMRQHSVEPGAQSRADAALLGLQIEKRDRRNSSQRS